MRKKEKVLFSHSQIGCVCVCLFIHATIAVFLDFENNSGRSRSFSLSVYAYGVFLVNKDFRGLLRLRASVVILLYSAV